MPNEFRHRSYVLGVLACAEVEHEFPDEVFASRMNRTYNDGLYIVSHQLKIPTPQVLCLSGKEWRREERVIFSKLRPRLEEQDVNEWADLFEGLISGKIRHSK